MDAGLKQKWVEALRSGEFHQAVGALRRDGGYCCLGVLCKVAGLAITEDGQAVEGIIPVGDTNQNYRPIYDLIGNDTDGIILWKMNDDDRADFVTIADWIDSHL